MSEHRYDIRISENCVDPNPLMIERQDPDNFYRFQTRKRCALEIAAYVFNGGNIATETFYTKYKIKSFIRFDEERCGLMFLVNVKFSTIDSFRKAFVNMNRQ